MVFCRVPPSVVLKTKQALRISVHPENAPLLVHYVISALEARCVVALMYGKGAGMGSIVLGEQQPQPFSHSRIRTLTGEFKILVKILFSESESASLLPFRPCFHSHKPLNQG